MTKPAPDLWLYSPDAAVESRVLKARDDYPASYPAGLDRVRDYFKALGDPHLKLPPVFHVAGTNGKGSTLAFLEAIFKAQGKRVHKFISPHLVRFEERVTIANDQIAPEVFAALYDECARAAAGRQVSFFEFFTGLAFLAFARHPADALLLETGMGGLHDATNVIPDPVVAIITRISFDHVHVLGKTLPEIARQKAGIIKQGCPAVFSPQAADVMKVLEQEASRQKSPIHRWQVEMQDDYFSYHGDHDYQLPLPALAGAHQVTNAATAIAAAEAAGMALSQDILSTAMKNVIWPARLQRADRDEVEIWIDGAHNDSGAESLCAEMKNWVKKPSVMITAFKGNKDAALFYRSFSGLFNKVYTLPLPGDAPMMPHDDLAALLQGMGFDAAALPSLDAAMAATPAGARVVVAGSLYLAGHALKCWTGGTENA